MPPEITSEETEVAKPMRFWQRMEPTRQWLSWAMMIAISIGGAIYFLGGRDKAQAMTADAIEARFTKIELKAVSDETHFENGLNIQNQKLEQIRTEMVSNDVFKAYQEMYKTNQAHTDQMLQQLLQKP